jgi:hypothetical protein
MLGDHIRALKGGKWVHGIDLGDQRVLHLVEDPRLAPGDRLRRVYKPEFTAGSSTVELVVHRERTYPARAVVARAWSRFMDPSVVAMFRDSESFAAWCKIGRVPEAAPVNGVAAAPAKAAAAPQPKAAPKAAATAKAAVTPKAKAKPAPRKAAKAPAKKAAAKAVARRRPPPRKSAKAVAKQRPAAKARPAKKAPPRKAARKKARPAARKKGRR